MIPIKDPQQVINAPTTALKDEEIFGGGFFDKIKKGLSVANNFLKVYWCYQQTWEIHTSCRASCVISCKLLRLQYPRLWRRRWRTQLLCGALNIRGGQCVPGLTFASKY